MFHLLVQLFFLINVQAGLVSNMPSTYKETGIPNSHLVSQNVVRGMSPRNEVDIKKLISLGVSDFLIFKIDTNGDVAKEISSLEKNGIDKNHITHLDFPWKDINDFQPICEMTIEALKTIEAAEKNNHKIYFHCSLGEDRTGYLAGLYKIFFQKLSVDDVFQSELCDKGYEAGDPNKGANIVKLVRESLTPSFLTMVKIITENKVLNKKLCNTSEFNNFSAETLKKYSCKKSK